MNHIKYSILQELGHPLNNHDFGMSRSVGHYLQQQGKYVIPNDRWGNERTYTTGVFDYIPAFSGIPKSSVVSIGT